MISSFPTVLFSDLTKQINFLKDKIFKLNLEKDDYAEKIRVAKVAIAEINEVFRERPDIEDNRHIEAMIRYYEYQDSFDSQSLMYINKEIDKFTTDLEHLQESQNLLWRIK